MNPNPLPATASRLGIGHWPRFSESSPLLTLNPLFDRLVRVQIRLLGRQLPAFQVAGYTGFIVALILSQALVRARGLSPWVMLAVSAIAVFAFLGLTMIIKMLTGKESLIYYYDEIAVLVAAAGLLAILRQPIFAYLDIEILGVGAFLAFGRVGCWLVGCCHGRPANWGACYRAEHVAEGFTHYYAGVRLFPIQLIESLWALGVVCIGSAMVLHDDLPGSALAWYVVAYDTGRFCFEFLRGDPHRPYLLGFSQPQWISVVLMCFVVWAETTGALLFQWWHLAVTASLILAMIAITLKRRLQKTPRYELLHPRHVREVAETLRLVNSTKDKIPDASGWTVIPESNIPALHLACTSLGIQISATRVRDVSGDLHHYTFSCRNGDMTEETARIVADLILQLQHANDEGELVNGNRHVFHLLVRPASG